MHCDPWYFRWPPGDLEHSWPSVCAPEPRPRLHSHPYQHQSCPLGALAYCSTPYPPLRCPQPDPNLLRWHLAIDTISGLMFPKARRMLRSASPSERGGWWGLESPLTLMWEGNQGLSCGSLPLCSCFSSPTTCCCLIVNGTPGLRKK